MGILVPRVVFRDITRITPAFLQKNGIKALVLDVDNTLTAPNSHELYPKVRCWLAEMRAAGVPMMIASNNTPSRVKPFAKNTGLPYISFCCKPSPYWLLAARRKWKLPARSIALVGDQIFTDLLGGHLFGAPVLLVRPHAPETGATVTWRRHLEAPIIADYYKKGGRLL